MASTLIQSASSYNILDIIDKGLAYAIIAAGLLSVVFIFVGGFSFILSGGDETKIKKAIGTIRYAIIGLIITVLAVVIVGTVGKLIGLDIIRYINFNDVIQNIQSLTGGLKSGSGSSTPSLS